MNIELKKAKIRHATDQELKQLEKEGLIDHNAFAEIDGKEFPICAPWLDTRIEKEEE